MATQATATVRSMSTSLPTPSRMTHIVLVFCTDLDKDPVSAHVLEQVLQCAPFEETDIAFDGWPVLAYRQATTDYHLVRLNDVLSHHYARYATAMNAHFAGVDAIVLVNWHQGAKAPNAIFTVQTTGDMASGHFSRVDPAICRKLFLAVEATRQEAGLDTFSTWMEATHWSGARHADQHDDPPHDDAPIASIDDLSASVIDLEIGSCPEDWGNPTAAAVLARALFRLADPVAGDGNHAGAAAVVDEASNLLPVLCIGGTHFEPGFTQLLRDHGATQGLALSHILPNHWLVAHDYDSVARDEAWAACAASIVGGVKAIVFHDNLKGSFKARARQLAESLGVPALSHKKLRTPDIAQALREAQSTN